MSQPGKAGQASDKPSCKVVLANTIAQGLLKEVRDGLSKLDEVPHLVSYLSNADPGAIKYAEYTAKTCIENGFKFTVQEVDKEDLEDTLLAANTDSSISGVLVYYPIFSSGQDAYLQQLVSLDKDVEGLSHRYLFNMYQNIRFLDAPANQKKSILPCTPLAVIKILEYLQVYNSILPYGDRLFGKTIAVINRSEVVGRPMAALLANDGATVYSIDVAGVQKFSRGSGIRKRKHEVKEVDGKTLADVLPSCDVVISGVPGDKFKVPLEHLKDGVVCINFSSDKNFDPEVKQKASIYVPAIGKVTIAILLRNLLRLVHNQSVK